MSRIAAILVSFCLGLVAASPCRAESGVDAARLQAARRMIVAMGFADLFVAGARQGFKAAAKKDPAWAENMAWALDEITPEAAADRIAPVYAEFFTVAQADELRLFFSTDPGRKFWRVLSAAALTGKKPSLSYLSAKDKGTIAAFLKVSEGWRVMNTSKAAINARLKQATAAWLQDINRRGISSVGRQLADILAPETAAAEPQEMTGAARGPMAKLLPLMRDYNQRNQKSIAEFQARADEIGLETVLVPANLVTREGIAAGRSKVDRFEQLLSRRVRDFTAATDELVAGLKALPAPAAFRRGFVAGVEKSATKAYERALRMEENQRALIALMRQVLTLADERFGMITLEDNTLVFDDTADLRIYNGLVERLQKEAAIEAELIEEEKRVRAAGLRKLRGTKASPAAQESSADVRRQDAPTTQQ